MHINHTTDFGKAIGVYNTPLILNVQLPACDNPGKGSHRNAFHRDFAAQAFRKEDTVPRVPPQCPVS